MADLLTEQIIERLQADVELAGLLAASVIDPAKPAVYSTIPVPPNPAGGLTPMPYIVAYAGDVASVSDDVLNPADGGYRQVMRDISAYDSKPDKGGGDATTVNAIAERVRAIFHRQPVVLAAPNRNLLARVQGPIVNDGERAFGRVCSVTFLVNEPAA